MESGMKRKLVLGLLGFLVAIALVLTTVLWRITHAPYGRMDLGPAILYRLMAFQSPEFTPEARIEAND
jgi:hypothetical protein